MSGEMLRMLKIVNVSGGHLEVCSCHPIPPKLPPETLTSITFRGNVEDANDATLMSLTFPYNI